MSEFRINTEIAETEVSKRNDNPISVIMENNR